MLKIRLQRVGRKNDASFRLVVIESTKAPQAGNYLEMLGSYNPKSNTKAIKVDRVKHWIGNGAQVSDSAHNLLVSEGVIEGKKINVLPKKSPIVDEEKIAAEAAAKKEAEEKATAEKEAAKEEKKEEKEEEVKDEAETPKVEAGDKEEESADEAPAEEVTEETDKKEEKKDDETTEDSEKK